MLKETLQRMNRALRAPAVQPYHPQRAVSRRPRRVYHWHVEIMPKLTKVAGFEWGDRVLHQPHLARGGARRDAAI